MDTPMTWGDYFAVSYGAAAVILVVTFVFALLRHPK